MSSAKWHPYSLSLNVFRNARHRKFSVSVPMIVQIWKYYRNSSKIPALKIPPEKKVVYAPHRRFPFRYVISLYWFWVRHYKAVGAHFLQDLAYSRSRKIGVYTFPIGLKLDSHFGSSNAKKHVNFQSQTKIPTSDFEASRSKVIERNQPKRVS